MSESAKIACKVSEPAQTAAAICEYQAMPDLSDREPIATGVTVIAMAGQLTRALTALLLDVNEIQECGKEYLSPPEEASLQVLLGDTLQQVELARANLRQLNVARHDPARGLGALSYRRKRYAGGAAIISSEAGRMPLRAREREALILICEGYTTKQGARRMQISPRTFESYRSEVMRKLGARNAVDLVRMLLLRSSDD